MTTEQQKALLQAGDLCGRAMSLDVESLEEYLDSEPADFRYKVHCYRVLDFARAMQSDLEKWHND